MKTESTIVVRSQAMVRSRKDKIHKNTNITRQNYPKGVRQKAGQNTAKRSEYGGMLYQSVLAERTTLSVDATGRETTAVDFGSNTA